MARKTVGYIELEWTCPNCGTQNKGANKTCSGCGMAQPENVEFHEPVKQELIEDTGKIDQAKAGPDIHCAYCGARNPAGATLCVNCGSNLSEGKSRQSGRVIGAFKTNQPSEVICPACGTSNPANLLVCSKCGSSLHPAPQPAAPSTPASTQTTTRKFPIWIPVVAVAAIGIIILLVLLFQQKDASANVLQRFWTRTVVIEQFGPVQHSDWQADIPSDAAILSCEEKHRSTSNEPVAGAREVCGTPYTVDKGSGFGEVVTDCEYQVYEDYCQYQVDEWSKLKDITSSGQEEAPAWPVVQLANNQRSGDQIEKYRIIFDVDGDQKTYDTSDNQIYNQAVIGSLWILKMNGLGQILEIQLAN